MSNPPVGSSEDNTEIEIFDSEAEIIEDEDLIAVEKEYAKGISEEDEKTIAFGRKFLEQVARINGVSIDRPHFLRAELKKAGISTEVLEGAIATTPYEAGVSADLIEKIARSTIELETRKSSAISFAAGLPGGFAMLATVPSDLLQYYVHVFRIMQKLAYLYGWQEFLKDMEELDDETLSKLALFLGVMTNVGGAATALNKFASDTARAAIQKQVASKALTKTWYYPIIKKTLNHVGVKVTKDSFAKGVSKAVPVAGGVISGGLTYSTLKPQSLRLMRHLQTLPQAGYFGDVPDELVDESSKSEVAKAKVSGALGKLKSKVPSVSVNVSFNKKDK